MSAINGFGAELSKAYSINSLTWPALSTKVQGQDAREEFVETWHVVADSKGSVYFSDWKFHRVIRVAADGSYKVIAGTGIPGDYGDNGPAENADLWHPSALAIDAQDNLYIADAWNGRIRKVSAGGIISTVAGGGASTKDGKDGDGGAATAAYLDSPYSLAFDPQGNMFIGEPFKYRIRKVDAKTGLISTYAGTGVEGNSGDNGPATAATFRLFEGLAADAAGNLFIADWENQRVRKITPDGNITSVLALATLKLPSGYLASFDPFGIQFAPDGSMYITNNPGWSQGSHLVLKCKETGACSIVAGALPTGTTYAHSGYAGDGGPATSAKLAEPRSVFVNAAGDLFISELCRIRKVTAAGVISTVAGSNSAAAAGDGGPGYLSKILRPRGVAVDNRGNVIVADSDGHRVWKLTPNGDAFIVAGTGTPGFSGDKGPAREAELANPMDVAVDRAGNIYIADRDNLRVRVVTPDSVIDTFAGRDFESWNPYLNDGLGPLNARFFDINYLATDGDGAVYVGGDRLPYRIPRNGVVEILWDFGAAIDDIAVDSDGNMYAVSGDKSNQVVRLSKNAFAPVVVAGNGVDGESGDGGPAVKAAMTPFSIDVDRGGNILISDRTHGLIRAVSSDGKIRTLSGLGFMPSILGDGENAADAWVRPAGIAAGDNGKIYFADQMAVLEANAVRSLEPANFFRSSITNTASYEGGYVAPGELVTIFGVDIGPTDLTIAKTVDGKFPTELANTRVLFDGIAAPIYYVQESKVTVVVPYALAGKDSTEVTIVYQGKTSNKVSIPVISALPGMFTISATGSGQAAIQHWPDYSVNGKTNPVQPGGVIMVYLTAGGDTGQDGAIATTAQSHPLKVTLNIGGKDAQVLYAGSAPGMVYGMLQINAKVPQDAPSGNAIPIYATVGGEYSQDGTTIAIAAPSN